MIFITFGSAFLLSAVSAYYSIVGLTTIFTGSFWPIVIMGVALEIGKLVTASWLYQNWQRTSWLLKTYLTAAVIMLMLITSMGIFGFLAKSHIDSTQDNKTNATELATLNTQESIAKARLAYLLARAKDPSTASNSLDRQIQDTQRELSKLNKEKAPLLKQENKLMVDVGPLVYVADLFYTDSIDSLDKAVRLVIMAIMFVFDPLAILLLIAGNTLLKERRAKYPPKVIPQAISEPTTVVAQPTPVAAPAPVAVTPTTPTPVVASTPANETKPPISAPTKVAVTPAPAPAPASPPQSPPADPNELERQLSTLLMTNNDIVAAYKFFYNRIPTAQDGMSQFKGMTSKQLLEVLCSSPEFLSREGVESLIVRASKKIEELQKSKKIH